MVGSEELGELRLVDVVGTQFKFYELGDSLDQLRIRLLFLQFFL